MSSVSAISGYAGASMPQQVAAPTAPAAQGVDAAAGSSSIVSLSQTSITASSESIVSSATQGTANKDLANALLLMLTLEYMKSNDDDEKKNLLGPIGALAQQQQLGGSSGAASSSLSYSSTSINIEMTDMQIVNSQAGLNAYAASGANPATVPGADSASGSIDVTG